MENIANETIVRDKIKMAVVQAIISSRVQDFDPIPDKVKYSEDIIDSCVNKIVSVFIKDVLMDKM